MTEEMRSTSRGSVPQPDPTLLTTEAISREVEVARQAITAEANLRREAQANLNREREEQLEALKELLKGDVAALDRTMSLQFDLVERQRVEQKKDTKDAVDAALTAQKEAVREQTAASDRAIAKSEASTTKLLEQLAETFATSIGELRRSIDEVKGRIGDVDKKVSNAESAKLGAKEDRTGLYAGLAVMGTLLLAILGVMTFVATRIP